MRILQFWGKLRQVLLLRMVCLNDNFVETNTLVEAVRIVFIDIRDAVWKNQKAFVFSFEVCQHSQKIFDKLTICRGASARFASKASHKILFVADTVKSLWAAFHSFEKATRFEAAHEEKIRAQETFILKVAQASFVTCLSRTGKFSHK